MLLRVTGMVVAGFAIRSFSEGWLQVAGCRLQVAGCGLQVAGCGLQVAGCGLRGAGSEVVFEAAIEKYAHKIEMVPAFGIEIK